MSPGRRPSVEVYLEVGKKRAFAGALEWPGWCRAGRDEDAALEALASSAERYRRVLRGTRLGFPGPDAKLKVRERLKGDATTDFGAPGIEPSADREPVGPADLERFIKLLRASWRAFDRAAGVAVGRELRKGPRGGGRSLDAIRKHVLESEQGYLGALGWKHRADPDANRANEIAATRKSVLEGLRASASGEIPARGPRGGRRWSARYFVRRTAWHAIDHAWEIEDRLE